MSKSKRGLWIYLGVVILSIVGWAAILKAQEIDHYLPEGLGVTEDCQIRMNHLDDTGDSYHEWWTAMPLGQTGRHQQYNCGNAVNPRRCPQLWFWDTSTIIGLQPPLSTHWVVTDGMNMDQDVVRFPGNLYYRPDHTGPHTAAWNILRDEVGSLATASFAFRPDCVYSGVLFEDGFETGTTERWDR